MPALEDAVELLYTAYDEGLRILDTAEAYGKAQEIIGIYHKRFQTKGLMLLLNTRHIFRLVRFHLI